MPKGKRQTKRTKVALKAKRQKRVEAKIAVPEVPDELVMLVALPAPVAKAPVLTWQAKGKQLVIRVKKFVLRNI